MNKSAVIYARVSSKEQHEEGYSIEAQLKLLRAYAKERGFAVLHEFTDIETAKAQGRQKFTAMVGFLRANKKGCKTILVEKTDRLHRNLPDWVTLNELNADLHLVKEGIVISEESRSNDKFMYGIKALMAKFFIDNLSEETKKGMTEKVEQGGYPGWAPLGYLNVQRNEKNVVEPDPEKARHVVRLFERHATGRYSIKELTELARSEGLTGLKGRTLHASMVNRALRNVFYLGEFDWKGRRRKGNHAPLITRELYEQVQAVMDGRGGSIPRPQVHRWAFTGVVTCGYCGCALTAERKKEKYTYYHCTGRRGPCPKPNVREEVLNGAFKKVLERLVLDPDLLSWLKQSLKESHSDERQYHDQEVEAAQAEIKKLQTRIDRLYVDKLDGVVNELYFKEKAAAWRSEQDTLQYQLDALTAANRSYLDEGVRLLELAQHAVILYEKAQSEEKQEILKLVCSNSTWRDGELTPEYGEFFRLLVDTNERWQKKRAASGEECDPRPIWLRR